jgi:hypothetical protein
MQTPGQTDVHGKACHSCGHCHGNGGLTSQLRGPSDRYLVKGIGGDDMIREPEVHAACGAELFTVRKDFQCSGVADSPS